MKEKQNTWSKEYYHKNKNKINGTRRKLYYRVSKYDYDSNLWLVVGWCLSRKQADEKAHQLQEQGFDCVVLKHSDKFRLPSTRGRKCKEN